MEKELVIDILSATKYENLVRRDGGDEVNVELPGRVALKKWAGGDLEDPEEIQASIAKVKVDKGRQINFTIEKSKAIQISGASLKKAKELASVYSRDGVQQFAAAIDEDLAKLYPLAGKFLSNNGAAIDLTTDNILNMLSVAQTQFREGNAWRDGKMVAIFSPAMAGLLAIIPGLLNSDKGYEDRKKGFVSELGGWKIYQSNSIVKEKEGDKDVYYPLFGIRGESLVSAKEKNLDIMHYVPEKSLDDAFKGAGMYGVGCVRPDKFAAAKVTVNLTI